MKKNILGYLVFVMLFVFTSCGKNKTSEKVIDGSSITSENLSTSTFNVEGMSCNVACPKNLKDGFGKVDGISVVEVNYDKKEVTISYDKTKLDENKLLEEFSKIDKGQYSATLLAVK